MHNIIVCTYDNTLMPEKKTEGSVCRDLKLADNISVGPGELKLVGTGIKTYMPLGWHAKIYARSGLGCKMGLMLANSVAVMDSDYRGEYIIQLFNFGTKEQHYDRFTRVVQIEFLPYYIGNGKFGTIDVPTIDFVCNKELYNNFGEEFISSRGEGRFNSTGII